VRDDLEADLAADERFERGVFWRELLIVVLIAALVAVLVIV
jgi:hypothetical protein